MLVLEIRTMSRPPTDWQILDLQNAESCTAWIVSFVAKYGAEKKEDKMNTDCTKSDLQVTNLFLSMCGQDAFMKLRGLMSLKKLVGTPFKGIRLVIQIYISPKERNITAERANLLSVVQGVRKFDNDLLEEVGYNFKKPSGNPVKSSMVVKAMVTCVIDVEESHTVASRVRL